MKIGEKICRVRREKKMTQEELGDLVGVSFQSVSEWERDISFPDPDHLVKMCEVLQVPVSAMLGTGLFPGGPESISDPEHMKTFIKTSAKILGLSDTLKALPYTEDRHAGQRRKNSDLPYIVHPLTLACHALALGIQEDAVIAACLLHDVAEDCGVTPEEMPVGRDVQELTERLTRHGTKDDRNVQEAYYRAIQTDPRACLIKCLDRINNLTTMAYGLSTDKQVRMIKETEEYVLPLLDILKDTPVYNNAAWLLKYQMISMLDIYKRYL